MAPKEREGEQAHLGARPGGAIPFMSIVFAPDVPGPQAAAPLGPAPSLLGPNNTDKPVLASLVTASPNNGPLDHPVLTAAGKAGRPGGGGQCATARSRPQHGKTGRPRADPRGRHRPRASHDGQPLDKQREEVID
jgi:hypothetical protein